MHYDLNHQLYSGLSDDFNQNFWLWNMSFGRKLFKNKLGEINISAFEINPGYKHYIKVIPRQFVTSDDFRDLRVEQRKCLK